MAARIVEGLFTCRKRWALEDAVESAGHRWRKPGPMSAIECVARILCWLDFRGDPKGRMHDATEKDVELAAGWIGKPGVLVAALVSTGWLDKVDAGMEWHDYGALNRLTLVDRQKKLHRDRRTSSESIGGRPRKEGDQSGDQRGDQTQAISHENRPKNRGLDGAFHHSSPRDMKPGFPGFDHQNRGDQTGDQTRDRTGDQRGEGMGASESGRSSEGSPSERPLALSARAPDEDRTRTEPSHPPVEPLKFGPPPGQRWNPRTHRFDVVDQAAFDAANSTPKAKANP